MGYLELDVDMSIRKQQDRYLTVEWEGDGDRSQRQCNEPNARPQLSCRRQLLLAIVLCKFPVGAQCED